MSGIDISGTVRERAARELRDRILTGVLPAGSRVDLDAITQEFATSRTPVREALLELSFEGLVQVAPRSGVTVLGISPDQPSKQLKFAQKYNLGFQLLSDADHATAEAFGVWGEKKNYGKTYMGIIRSAFLIDEKGVIRGIWRKVKVPGHADELLKAAEALS